MPVVINRSDASLSARPSCDPSGGEGLRGRAARPVARDAGTESASPPCCLVRARRRSNPAFVNGFFGERIAEMGRRHGAHRRQSSQAAAGRLRHRSRGEGWARWRAGGSASA
jgi:hypothetical protein